MKLKINPIHTFLILAIFLFSAPVATAQTGFDDDVDDEPEEVPAQPFAIAGLMLGAFAGYYLIRKSVSESLIRN